AVAAFIEYADDQLWIASHLTQLLGVALIVCALIQLSRLLASGSARGLAWIGAAGAIASLAVAATLQAVDGIALKMMVDAWAAAAEPDKTILFYVTYGVRQVEVGLASIMSLLFGLTMCVYGVAVISDHSFAKWLGWIAIIGGIPTAIAGVVIAYTGFSGLAMSINVPSNSLLLIWMIALGVLFLRRDTEESATGSSE
ncbi:MAG: DUF4386 family protein, partial [Gammaproteobacteria bacterium]|nr:DUF4386 family protein [Gammaproteobacteria bacterium]